jgi:predicted DNA-binding WGR domain protein
MSSNIVQQPSAMRWESQTRYYVALAQQDLFGGWELMRAWGGRGSRRGGGKVDPMPSRDAALLALQREGRRRKRRGYAPTATTRP